MPLQLTWTDFSEIFDDDSLLVKLDFEPVLPMAAGGALENHLFIEGDNYPVLKKLAGDFAGKVNLIYIDPPYNTGNDFTYNDDFATGQDRHSQWLSFMQRRLLAARPLLKETGCIFIAIDQSELYTLKLLCDQIFGEENFVNDFMWLHGKGKKDTWSRTLQQHTLCYARDKKQLPAFREVQSTDWATKNADNDPRGNWFSGSISFTEKRSNPNHQNYYSITSPGGKIWTRQWQTDEAHMKELIADNRIFWGSAPAYDKVPRVKIFNDEESEVIPRNIIEPKETTRAAQHHLDELLGRPGAFDNPKPVSLIKHLIEITRQPKDALILDFFAGSGTTFEAVCELNALDEGHRRCILVQKDENGIFDLCKKRCEKIAEKYSEKTQSVILIS
ncbi:MAG: site-specific DNA-methyltransferase [Treponema sp.]|nr:site-specific DNA-methyltransferase [Treponema sp.]